MPYILFINTKSLSPIVGYLSTTTVNKYGLGLINLVKPEKEKYLSYQQGSTEKIQVVTGGGALYNADHFLSLGEERCDG